MTLAKMIILSNILFYTHQFGSLHTHQRDDNQGENGWMRYMK